jgi:hypothetical protein
MRGEGLEGGTCLCPVNVTLCAFGAGLSSWAEAEDL